jgi:hypothetical protein
MFVVGKIVDRKKKVEMMNIIKKKVIIKDNIVIFINNIKGMIVYMFLI